MVTSAQDLRIHISTVEDDFTKHVSLLSSLDDKLASCQRENDSLEMTFWADRVKEKRMNIKALKEELQACQGELASISNKLDGDAAGVDDTNLRHYAERESREESLRATETLDELAAWRAGNDFESDRYPFPPLETLLQAPVPHHYGHFGHHHPRHHGRFGSFGRPPPPPPMQAGPPEHLHGHGHVHGHYAPQHRGNDGVRTIMEHVSDVVTNSAAATSLVPTREIKGMLDNFLFNLTNQLANTFEGAPLVASADAASETEPLVPGAFVQPKADVQTQTQRHETVEEKVIKPCSKLGKGGFRHKHISCDGCLTSIRGMRYKCEVSSKDIVEAAAD